jgi:FkbM family methyltransferase
MTDRIAPSDILLNDPALGRDILIPSIGLLFSFAAFSRFPSIRSDAPLRILDVGGCVGGYTLAGQVHFPNATFDIFEPFRQCHPYLEHNLRGLDNVTVHKVAVSDKRETLTMSFPVGKENLGLSTLHGAGLQAEQVEAFPLDELVQGRVDVIKMDVEGHELWALEGAQRILSEWHPRILIEIKNVNQSRAGRSETELMGYLLNHGYGVPEHIGNDYLFEWGVDK